MLRAETTPVMMAAAALHIENHGMITIVRSRMGKTRRTGIDNHQVIYRPHFFILL